MHSEKDSESALNNWYLRSRHRFIAAIAAKVTKGGAVLDAGCGSGAVSEILKAKGLRVVCCDTDAAALQKGVDQGRLRHVEVADVTNLPFESAAFDGVVCSEVLEHVPDDGAALRELLRVSKGPIVISVPAHAYLWTQSDTMLGHHRRYSRQMICELLKKSGAKPIRLGRCHAIPGLGVLTYKFIRRIRGTKLAAVQQSVPNAIRFSLPRWLDSTLYALSCFELLLSRFGLIPWGFAWWAVVKTDQVGENNKDGRS